MLLGLSAIAVSCGTEGPLGPLGRALRLRDIPLERRVVVVDRGAQRPAKSLTAETGPINETPMPQLANKVVITCAITGSIHTPTMSDALPITPVRSPPNRSTPPAVHDPASARAIRRTAGPRPTRRCFASFCRASSRAATDHQHYRRRRDMTVEERIAVAETFAPEMCCSTWADELALYLMARATRTGNTTGETYLLNSTRTFSVTPSATSSARQDAGRRAWREIRTRVLRHRPPPQSRPLHRQRPVRRRSSCS